jgi:PrtD family type I secretion system ABC transporter
MTVLEIYRNEKSRLKRSMVSVAVISLCASLCLLAVPLYLFQVYDRVIFSRNLDTLIAITLIAALVLVAFGILDAIRTSLLTKIGINFEARLSGLLLGAELSRSHGVQRQSMFYLARIRQVLASNVMPAVFDLPVLVVFLVLVFLIHPLLGGVVLGGGVVLALIAMLNEVMTGNISKEAQEAGIVAQKSADAAIVRHELVKSMGLYREIVDNWSKYQTRHLNKLTTASVRGNGFASASRSARQLIQICLIGTGAYLVLQAHLSAGIIFAASMVGSRALAPVEQLIAGWRSLRLARNNFKLLEARLATLDLPEVKTSLPRPLGILAADNVVYAPPIAGAQPILKGIKGAFKPGSATAIVGPSGAGKSTFAKCLVGYLVPNRGRITLDGQDLQAWDPVARGLHIGYLPQMTEFFEGTVRENIARLRTKDDPQHAIDAARFVGVHDMIMNFPAGYDTVISEDGFQPSGGQKQLLGLARTFYGNPSVVVLDEPNSSLDGDGEKILRECLKSARKADITVIIVTQRMSITRLVDNVLVLKNGSVESYGPPTANVGMNNVSAFPRSVDTAKAETANPRVTASETS